MSTTTMHATRIGFARAKESMIRTICIACFEIGEQNRTEPLDLKNQNNCFTISEPKMVADYTRKAYIISFEALYNSFLLCKKGVSWKPSVKQFTINLPRELLRLHDELENKTYKQIKPLQIKIMYPKKRDGLSIRFKDRIYQRSVNDNLLYPLMTKSFIYTNLACQKGKGQHKARLLLLGLQVSFN